MILTFLKRIFSFLFKKADIFYIDFEDYEDYVRGQDVSYRDVLLGAVKSKEQYEINLKYNFYHIPIDIIDAPEKVKYVALYRSKNFYSGENPGVLHYARVVSYQKLKRRDISELLINFSPDNLYYRFNVLEWNELDSPVKAKEIGPVNGYMTNLYLLQNSHYVYQLYSENNDAFKLSLAIYDLVSGVYEGLKINNFRLYVKRKKIFLLSKNNKFFFKITHYKQRPYEILTKISSIVFDV